MSYPNLPKNRLIVNGIDLTERYGLILVDGYTLEPPEPKTYTVDIPGGNGVIDLTDSLSGDTVYSNRSQEFDLYAIYIDNFEKLKTDISNLLHGKSFDYKITMDPDYTYHGRFTVSSYVHSTYSNGKVGVIHIKIDADPYKYKKQQIIRADAVGGIIVNCNSGRMRVRPSIETSGFLRVIFEGKQYELSEGTWAINDMILSQGVNDIYLCSYDIRNFKWSDLKSNEITWGDFKKKRLFEWYKLNGDVNYVDGKWNNLSFKTWDDLKDTTWSDLRYSVETLTESVYKSKKWSDLETQTWADLEDTTWNDLVYRSEIKIDDIFIAYDWGDL